jgi:hypothetical protein
LSSGQEINDALGDVGLHFELFECCGIEICGVLYKPSCYIVHAVVCTGEKHVFALLQNIFTRAQPQGENI